MGYLYGLKLVSIDCLLDELQEEKVLVQNGKTGQHHDQMIKINIRSFAYVRGEHTQNNL